MHVEAPVEPTRVSPALGTEDSGARGEREMTTGVAAGCTDSHVEAPAEATRRGPSPAPRTEGGRARGEREATTEAAMGYMNLHASSVGLEEQAAGRGAEGSAIETVQRGGDLKSDEVIENPGKRRSDDLEKKDNIDTQGNDHEYYDKRGSFLTSVKRKVERIRPRWIRKMLRDNKRNISFREVYFDGNAGYRGFSGPIGSLIGVSDDLVLEYDLFSKESRVSIMEQMTDKKGIERRCHRLQSVDPNLGSKFRDDLDTINQDLLKCMELTRSLLK